MAVRKRAALMTTAEKNRFKSVITNLVTAAGDPNPYGRFVSIHGEDHMHHPFMGGLGVQRFLPWHRVYLLKLEQMGQAIDPLFFIPYWDWRMQRVVPPWLQTFKPTVKVVGPNITVTRSPRRPPPLPSTADIATLAGIPGFTNFTLAFDGFHGDVHMWCHGTMSSIPTAPADPLFWLHHAMIDKIWADWQVTHPGVGPVLAGANAVMDPWPETAAAVASIAALGYSYGP